MLGSRSKFNNSITITYSIKTHIYVIYIYYTCSIYYIIFMVMHARKRQRINDSFYDKKSSSNIGISPLNSNGSNDSSRSANKPWSSSSRINGSSNRISPRSRGESRYRRNSPRNEAIHKPTKKMFGDWSEHVSSSAKVYYYNCRTEVSQWDKPEAWLEDEKATATPLSSKSSSYGSSNNGTPLNRGHRLSLDSRDSLKHRRLSSNSKSEDKADQNDHMHTVQRLVTTGSVTTTPTSSRSKEFDHLHRHHSTCTPERRESPASEGTPIFSPSRHHNACSTPASSTYHSGETPAKKSKLDIIEEEILSYTTKLNNDLQLLTDPFKSIFDPSLIEHIKNWIANSSYTQAKSYRMEAEKIALEKLSWQSTNLKMSRSKVRYQDINITQNEQRILYLQKQNIEIENSKYIYPSSTTTSLTSSSTTSVSTSILPTPSASITSIPPSAPGNTL